VNNVSWFKLGRCFMLNHGMKWPFNLPGKRNKYAATYATYCLLQTFSHGNYSMAQNSLYITLYTCCVRYQMAFAPFCTNPQLGASNYERLRCTEVATGHRRNGHTFCSIQLAFRRVIKSQKRENQCVSTAHWTPSRSRSVYRRADTTRPLQHMIPITCICQCGCTVG